MRARPRLFLVVVSSCLLGITFYAASAQAGRKPATNKPPTARLSVTQIPIPPLTVIADGSASTDRDAKPIATYRFDFGDGTPAVVTNAPTAKAQHTYARAGTYTVRLTATDTGNLASSTVSLSIAVKAEVPPTAKLTVTQAQSPALTVLADGSGSSDADLTPIASYRFDFGDGKPAVVQNAPNSTASHTYAAEGAYTVTLIATDTANNASAPVTASIKVLPPPPDYPPIAKLTVTQAASPPLTAIADGSGSTDTDQTPIASYRFTFGDGSAPVTTTFPNATASHTYAKVGTYTVTLLVTDTAGKTSAPVTRDVVISQTSGGGDQVAVYAGYYDTHHAETNPKPNPWMGSSNVVFLGKPDNSQGGWDTSAIRVDNLTSGSLTCALTVDMGSKRFALWSPTTIPAGGRLIAAQTAFENFDGSDTNPAGCYSCSPKDCLTKVSSIIPVVNLTINGVTTKYYDPGQILNTHGVDAAGCPYTGIRNDESSPWQQIFATAPARTAASPSATSDSDAFAAAPGLSLSPPHPNPSRGDIEVRFRLGSRTRVQLALFDVAGRLERMCAEVDLEPGEYSQQVDLRGLPAGMHYFRLTTPNETLHHPVVLVR